MDFKTFKNSVNGELFDTEKHRNGINPATLEKNPDVPIATREDLEKAVNGAKAAFKKWSNTPYTERQKIVMAFAQGLEDVKEEFAKMLTQEQGKPASRRNSSCCVRLLMML